MVMTGRDWQHAGISSVKRYEKDGNRYYKICIPDRLYSGDEDDSPILRSGRQVYWSYEVVSNVLVISSAELREKSYEYLGSVRFGGDSNNRITVPKRLIISHPVKGNTSVTASVPEKIQIDEDARMHFMFHEGMKTDRPRSCYVLTDKKFRTRFANSDKWDGKLDQVPRFS